MTAHQYKAIALQKEGFEAVNWPGLYEQRYATGNPITPGPRSDLLAVETWTGRLARLDHEPLLVYTREPEAEAIHNLKLWHADIVARFFRRGGCVGLLIGDEAWTDNFEPVKIVGVCGHDALDYLVVNEAGGRVRRVHGAKVHARGCSHPGCRLSPEVARDCWLSRRPGAL